MVYKDQFVAVVKCNGKVLREIDGVVRLPFTSEYEILMKNLSARDALVKIQIDGQEVSQNGVIVPAGKDVPIERFINGNMNEGNRFKFIKKTQKIIENRGDRLDDGIIRIEYWYEKPKTIQITDHHHHHHHHHHEYWDWWRPYKPYYGPYWISTGSTLTTGATGGTFTMSAGEAKSENVSYTCSSSVFTCSASDTIKSPESIVNDAVNIQADEGITVPGSISNQQFVYGAIGELEPNSSVIIIRLAGMTNTGQTVTQPVTTKMKIKCTTCGTEHKSNAKFCIECGTSLQIV